MTPYIVRQSNLIWNFPFFFFIVTVILFSRIRLRQMQNISRFTYENNQI
jgi:hypothetical protein